MKKPSDGMNKMVEVRRTTTRWHADQHRNKYSIFSSSLLLMAARSPGTYLPYNSNHFSCPRAKSRAVNPSLSLTFGSIPAAIRSGTWHGSDCRAVTCNAVWPCWKCTWTNPFITTFMNIIKLLTYLILRTDVNPKLEEKVNDVWTMHRAHKMQVSISFLQNYQINKLYVHSGIIWTKERILCL